MINWLRGHIIRNFKLQIMKSAHYFKCIVILATLFTSMTIYGQTEATINNIKYTLYKDSATVMQQSISLSGNITIPEKVIYDNKEYTVSALVNKVFYQCSEIKFIKLLSSITNLSDDCFSQCTKLSSITFPSNIKSLGESCFYLCNNHAHNIEYRKPPFGLVGITDGTNLVIHFWILESLHL